MLFGGGNDKLFGILCEGLGRPEWASDPRYRTNAARVANRAGLEAAIEAISATRTTREWLDAFEGKGMPYAAVNDVRDALDHPHTRARGMVVDSPPHAACDPFSLVAHPVKYIGGGEGQVAGEGPGKVRSAPPLLGQHTDEVLGELLGFGGEEIRAMRDGGVVS